MRTRIAIPVSAVRVSLRVFVCLCIRSIWPNELDHFIVFFCLISYRFLRTHFKYNNCLVHCVFFLIRSVRSFLRSFFSCVPLHLHTITSETFIFFVVVVVVIRLVLFNRVSFHLTRFSCSISFCLIALSSRCRRRCLRCLCYTLQTAVLAFSCSCSQRADVRKCTCIVCTFFKSKYVQHT